MTWPTPAISFAQLLQDFFCKYLLAQRNASPRTISSYRDAFRLLLRYVQDRARKPIATLTLAELDAPVLHAFLEHLERDRRNGIRSRNARLAALRTFYRYAATREPLSLPIAQRVLAIPAKRHDLVQMARASRREPETPEGRHSVRRLPGDPACEIRKRAVGLLLAHPCRDGRVNRLLQRRTR